ncbi:MAG: nuclear transport factor 2 family protein [Solirubrobacterales bacterium]|nr:nuclear transport factor 2 family protein [Solirubrobacterales bacterium]
MPDATTAAQHLYSAFAAHDGQALLDAMTEDFVGEVSSGMPLGVGGRHQGREAMLRECWAPVFVAYDVNVEADRYLEVSPSEVVALGFYRGQVRDTGIPFEARFAHVLGVRDDLICSLEQITDTGSWGRANGG